jgi:hypothetical protein
MTSNEPGALVRRIWAAVVKDDLSPFVRRILVILCWVVLGERALVGLVDIIRRYR